MKDVIPNFDTYDPYNAKYFMSVGAHKKERFYPHHDLEAFAYMIHFLFRECLPHAGSNSNEPCDELKALEAGKDQRFFNVRISLVYSKLCDCF